MFTPYIVQTKPLSPAVLLMSKGVDSQIGIVKMTLLLANIIGAYYI